MRLVKFLPLLLLLLPVPSVAGDDVPLAADVTERGRGLPTAIDRLLVPHDAGTERTVWLLVDVTDSLRRSPFADALAESLGRNAKKLARTKIGVARVGADGIALPPTGEHARVSQAVRSLLEEPGKTFQDVYTAVRRIAAAPASGKREIVLVSLENGDAELEIEAAVAALSRANARFSAIAREAFLSDSYWVNRESLAPRRYSMNGGEAAFIEVPWLFLFQQRARNEVVPSGFAMYGITRLAAATGGKVYLYYPPSNTPTQCAWIGSCPFCANDQIGAHEFYEAHRLRALSPLAGSRSEVFAVAGRDPYLRAVLKTWSRASREGLLLSRPSVRSAGSSLRPERRQRGNPTTFGTSLGFSGQASKAEKLAVTCGRMADDLAEEIEGIESGIDRYRAVAEYTVLMLRLTRLNLLYFTAFCQEVGPEQLAMAREGATPPQRAFFGEDQIPAGIYWSGMTLSHGVEPFYELHLPGGETTDEALRAFQPAFRDFLARYAKTPFGEAARQSGIARFYLTFRGKGSNPVTRQPRSSEKDDTTTEKERPSRGGGSSGSGGGATSGGK
jgi:hypothetical protein